VKGYRLAVAFCLLGNVLMAGTVAAAPPPSGAPATHSAGPAVEAAQKLRAECNAESGRPAGPDGQIDINGGAATTASAKVTLSLPVVDECARVTSVRLSNDGWSWRALDYSSELSWSLLDPAAGGSNGTGLRTVWAQWVDSRGSRSAIERASITFAPVRPNAAVTYSISGKVTGPGPVNLEGIQIEAVSESLGVGATTASDGTYTINGAYPGDYTVMFWDTRSAQTYLPGYYGASGFTYDASEAATVTVVDADITGIDVQMPLALHIEGTVTDGTNPLEEIAVYVETDTYTYSHTVSTATDGTYVMPVPAGDYTVGFYDMGDVYLSGYYDETAPSGFALDWDYATVLTVDTADITGIDVAMIKATGISGKITIPGGGPLADATVTAWNTEHWGTTSYTAADGTYSLSVPPGTFWMSVEPDGTYLPGYYSAYFGTTHFTTSEGAETFFSVGSAPITINMQVPLGKVISGTVTDESDNPLANISVGARFGEFYTWVSTAADGTYGALVPSGSFTIRFQDRDDVYLNGYYGSSGFTIDPDAAAVVTVTSSSVSGIDAQLVEGYQIEGTVTDPSFDPLQTVNVEAFSASYEAWGWTDADGNYSVTVPPGSYYLSFIDQSGEYLTGYYSTGGYTIDYDSADTVDVVSADVTGIDVQFASTPHIQGTITLSGGSGYPSYRINAASDAYINWGYAEGDGTYSVAVPAADSYMVTFADNVEYRAGFYSASGFTTNQAAATSVVVGSSDVTGIDVEIPAYGPVTRLSGSGRFATAAAISAQTFAPGVNVAYIAYAYNFPDALAGAAAAGSLRGPVLLVNTTGPIDPATATELIRLKPQQIAVLGSAGVISESVKAALVPYAWSGSVVRLSGAGRFATAAKISAAVFEPGVPVAYVAYAYNFPDALAGAAAAGRIQGPVLLANTTGALDAATVTELQRLKPYRIVVLGSTGVISEAVRTSLIPYTQSGLVSRFSGTSRFATAGAVSAATFPPGVVDIAYIAYAYNFPDALAGAAAAGWNEGPVLLVNTTGTINPATAAELTRLKPYRIIVLGSSGVISDAVMTQLAAYATMPKP
jgi:putative cell wall-binding protein